MLSSENEFLGKQRHLITSVMTCYVSTNTPAIAPPGNRYRILSVRHNMDKTADENLKPPKNDYRNMHDYLDS